MLKVALVHDQLTQYGGAERVLDVFHEIFPEAPIYTTIYLKDKLPKKYEDYNIKTSFLDKIPYIRKIHKLHAPLFPFAISQFYLKDFDLVLSDTQGIAKGIRTNKKQIHISYVHTIPWAVWNLKNEKGRFFTKLIGQKWDYNTAQKPTILIANSNNTKFRICKYYDRESQVIYPPVEVSQLLSVTKTIDTKENYIIFVGRLEGYKGEMELAKACTELEQKVIFIGTGSNSNKLINYSKFVELKENVKDDEKAILIKKAKALFNGSNEDFGINMAEAIALNTPVIALNKGGSLEIIKDGYSGILIDNLDIPTIKEAINKIPSLSKNYFSIDADRFSKENFVKNIKNMLHSYTK